MLEAYYLTKLANSSRPFYCFKKKSSVASDQPKGSKSGFLLTFLLIYLIGSRVGPVVFRVGNSLNDTFIENCRNCLTEDSLSLIKQGLHLLRAFTRAPSILTR